MSLTKRLYCLDEVRAALFYSIKTRNLLESIFWLTELEESCYGGEARRILFLSWAWYIGFSRIAWLLEWVNQGTTREGRLQLCWQLVNCSERDVSIPLLVWAGLVESNYSLHLSRYYDRWISVANLDDISFWQPLLDSSTDEQLDSIYESLQNDMRSYRFWARAVGLGLSIYWKNIPISSFQELSNVEPECIVGEMLKWSTLISLREQRVYSIPYSSFYGFTRRGTGFDTMNQLHWLGKEEFEKSPYWKPKVWVDDDTKESFYDTYFNYKVCDIPDEWSQKDREKSHGHGLPCEYGASLWKWWDIWIGKEPHRWVLGKLVEKTYEWSKTQRADTDGTVLDKLYLFYTSMIPIEVTQRKKVWSTS